MIQIHCRSQPRCLPTRSGLTAEDHRPKMAPCFPRPTHGARRIGDFDPESTLSDQNLNEVFP
jgi:hypothetical protein